MALKRLEFEPLFLRDLTDEQLVKLAQKANDNAFEEIIKRYRTTIYFKARPYFLMGGQTQDLVQEGFIGLLSAVRMFSGQKGDFCSFANICVTRQILTAIKQSNRKKHRPLNFYLSIDKASVLKKSGFYKKDVCDPITEFIQANFLAKTNRTFLKKLSTLEMKVCEMYLSGLSYSKIAEHLRTTEKKVDNTLQRVKKKSTRHFNNNK